MKQLSQKRTSPYLADMPALLRFWEKLSNVNYLSFNAQTRLQDEYCGWQVNGRGSVIVSHENDRLMFNEKGVWKGRSNTEMSFSNAFRWTLDPYIGVISLEHLHRGVEHPVFLFHLAPSSCNSLSAVDSYLCGSDAYFGQIYFYHFGFKLSWRVIGPKKNEAIDCFYS